MVHVRAVGFRAYGGPEVLEMLDLPEPVAGPGQIRVRSVASTVNPADVLFREGGVARLIAPGVAPYVPGLEFSGVVDQTGPGSRFRVGEAVMAITAFIPTGRGAHSEFVVVDDDSAALIPEGISFSEAATLPMNGLTAQLAVDRLKPTPGSTVLVTGAAGAVGGYTVELAKLSGANVLALASPADRGLMMRLGARVCITSLAGIRPEAPEGLDALVDAAGIGGDAVAFVKVGGRVVTFRPPSRGSQNAAARRGIEVVLVSVREYQHNRLKLSELASLASSGDLSLRVAGTITPGEASVAHQRLVAGGVRGRIVVQW